MQIIQINRADKALLISLHKLQISSYLIEAEIVGSYDLPPLKETLENIQKSSDIIIGLINDENQIKAAVFIDHSKIITISKLIVSPDSFRKGYARSLVNHVLSMYKGQVIEVSTATENNPARALYEKFGFKLKSEKQTPERVKIVTYALKH